MWLLNVCLFYIFREKFSLKMTIVLELGPLHFINKFGQRLEACETMFSVSLFFSPGKKKTGVGVQADTKALKAHLTLFSTSIVSVLWEMISK